MEPAPNENSSTQNQNLGGFRYPPSAAAGQTAAAIRLDGQGRISDATVSAAAMLGFEPQELRGRTLKDLALEGWQAAAEVASARVRFGATESFELALRGRSGRRTLVEMTAKAGKDGDPGAVIAWSERRMRKASAAQDADSDLKRVAYGLLRTQEAERMRVAMELHDEVAPIVVMVKYMIEDAVGKLGLDVPPESASLLNGAAARLRDVISELRRISTDLRPRLLDDLGLVPTLEWYCRGVEEACSDLKVSCQLSVPESEIPSALKLDIFRIVQEAMSNVLEHAHAHRAQVSLFVTSGDELCVVVDDDGEGFDMAAATSKRDGELSLGLQSIRKRVEATGGRLLFDSTGQRGTRIGGAWRRDTETAAA
jgi:two-component system NarL family sensor kinase